MTIALTRGCISRAALCSRASFHGLSTISALPARPRLPLGGKQGHEGLQKLPQIDISTAYCFTAMEVARKGFTKLCQAG